MRLPTGRGKPSPLQKECARNCLPREPYYLKSIWSEAPQASVWLGGGCLMEAVLCPNALTAKPSQAAFAVNLSDGRCASAEATPTTGPHRGPDPRRRHHHRAHPGQSDHADNPPQAHHRHVCVLSRERSRPGCGQRFADDIRSGLVLVGCASVDGGEFCGGEAKRDDLCRLGASSRSAASAFLQCVDVVAGFSLGSPSCDLKFGDRDTVNRLVRWQTRCAVSPARSDRN